MHNLAVERREEFLDAEKTTSLPGQRVFGDKSLDIISSAK